MKPEEIDKNLTIIIRSVGERTTEACRQSIVKQVAEENVHIVEAVPFTKALLSTFFLGLEEGRKWTLAVDADVIIKPTAIGELIAYAETAEENVFMIEGKVIDKFLESPREAGVHLYRTDLFEKALPFIPAPKDAIRPETHVRNHMNDLNFTFIKTDILAGVHDFEQFYKDIYRKCFIQASKHRQRVEKIFPKWEKKAENDNDFIVAIAGFIAGTQYKYPVSIDVNAEYLEGFEAVLTPLKLTEKERLHKSNFLDDNYFLLYLCDHLSTSLKEKKKIVISLNRSLADIKKSYIYRVLILARKLLLMLNRSSN